MTDMNKIVHPVSWAQRKNCIYLKISLHDCDKPDIKIYPKEVNIKHYNSINDKVYTFVIELYKDIVPEECNFLIVPWGVQLTLKKKEAGPFWPSLLKSKEKQHWLKIDFSKWIDEEDEECSTNPKFQESIQPGGNQKPLGSTKENLKEFGAELQLRLKNGCQLLLDKDYNAARFLYASVMGEYMDEILSMSLDVQIQLQLPYIIYVYGMTEIMSGDTETIGLQMIQNMLKDYPYSFTKTMPLQYGIVKGLMALNRYDEAKVAINEGLESAVYVQPSYYPGTDVMIPESNREHLIAMLKQLDLECRQGIKPAASESPECEDDEEMEQWEQISVATMLFLNRKYDAAFDAYSNFLNQNSMREFKSMNQVVQFHPQMPCIIYSYGMAGIMSGTNEKISCGLQNLLEMFLYNKCMFPYVPLQYGIVKGLMALNRYDEAIFYINEGLESATFMLPSYYPGTDVLIPESNGEHLKAMLKQLDLECRQGIKAAASKSPEYEDDEDVVRLKSSSLDGDTKAESFALIVNGTELKNEHEGEVEVVEIVKGMEVEKSQEPSKKVQKQMEKGTKESRRKTRTEEIQTGPEPPAAKKERFLPVGAPTNWMPIDRTSGRTQSSNGQVGREVNSPIEDFGAWLKRNFIKYLQDFGPLYLDHDSVLQVFNIFHSDADEFILNCGGLHRYLMSRPEFILIENIICLEEHETFVIENITELSKRKSLKQNRDFNSIFVLGEKRPRALSEIDDDFNEMCDLLPNERDLINRRQGEPPGETSDILDYQLRDVDDNFFEVFDSFNSGKNRFNVNSTTPYNTDCRGQTKLYEFSNEPVLGGRTKLTNSGDIDGLNAQLVPKERTKLTEIDDFDEFSEDEHQVKYNFKSKTSSQTKKGNPQAVFSNHHAHTISAEPTTNEVRKIKNEFEDLFQKAERSASTSSWQQSDDSSSYYLPSSSPRSSHFPDENCWTSQVPNRSSNQSVIDGESEIPPNQNLTDEKTNKKLMEILEKKDKVIEDLISLNETLKNKNLETLEKERHKLKEKFQSDERLLIQKLNMKENEVKSLRNENEKLQLQVEELMNRLGSEILERNRRDNERFENLKASMGYHMPPVTGDRLTENKSLAQVGQPSGVNLFPQSMPRDGLEGPCKMSSLPFQGMSASSGFDAKDLHVPDDPDLIENGYELPSPIFVQREPEVQKPIVPKGFPLKKTTLTDVKQKAKDIVADEDLNADFDLPYRPEKSNSNWSSSKRTPKKTPLTHLVVVSDLKNPKPSSSRDGIKVNAGASWSRPSQDIKPSNHSQQIKPSNHSQRVKPLLMLGKSTVKLEHSKASTAPGMKAASQKKGWAQTDKQWRGAETVELECIICSEMMNNDRRQLPCKHIFHDQCIGAWLKTKPTCPICRLFVLPDEEYPTLQ